MCIYYIDKENLSYKSQEHVFPAAIGGKLKLNYGVVSHEFNNDISKLERDFIKNSLLSIPREIQGPGKRGKLGDKHATKSKVFVVRNANDQTKFALGYLKKGKSTEIPHVSINWTTGQVVLSFDVSDRTYSITKFKEKFVNQSDDKIKNIICDDLPKDFTLIGITEEVERNYTCYVAQHSENDKKLKSESLKKLAPQFNFDATKENRERYQPLVRQSVHFDLDHFRIYAKVAFNFIAYLKGAAYVKREQFDSIRNFIAFGGENNFVNFDNDALLPTKEKFGFELPEFAHAVLVYKVEDYLFSTVYFYGHFAVNIILAKDFTEAFNFDGLICDWKKSTEISIEDYIATMLNHESN